MLRMVKAAIRPLKTKMSMVVARVVVTAIQDSPALQTVTVNALFGESFDKIQHMQPGGLSHVALPGAEGLMLCLGGSREAPFVFAVSNRALRPTGGAAGETVMYAAEVDGVQARLKVGGPLEVTSDGDANADDFVAMAGRTGSGISTMLAAGVAAGGAGAANFTAAKTSWDALILVAATDIGSENLKANNKVIP